MDRQLRLTSALTHLRTTHGWQEVPFRVPSHRQDDTCSHTQDAGSTESATHSASYLKRDYFTRNTTCVSHCLPTRDAWYTGLGQLAGIKLDLQVSCCSAGLKAILKAPPAVMQQWEDMDDGQGKQLGASRAPGGLHLLALSELAPLCSG